MSLDADTIVDRRRMRRKLTFWRISAVVVAALAIVGAEYVLRWLPRGTHSWDKFITPRELETEISKHGLSVDYRGGVIFNPLLNQWKLSRDMDVNYMLTATRD